MLGLEERNLNFLLISSNNINDIVSVLYAKEYNVIPIKEFYRGVYTDSVIASSNIDNDEMRKDALFLLEYFNENNFIIKYKGEENSRIIFNSGAERPLDTISFNTNENIRSYIYNGFSFSFTEAKRYWKPTKREDFKVGMIVEYFNNNKWYEKEVIDPFDEYNKMYKLLIKYDKIRVLSKS